MQPERKDTVLIITAGILGLVAVVAITLALLKRGSDTVVPLSVPAEENPAIVGQEERAFPTDIPTTAPEIVDQSPVSVDVREPEPLSDDVEARIQAIADRIGKGEITREEGQRQINELLGI